MKANEYSPQGYLLSSIEGKFVKQAPMKARHVAQVESGLEYKYYIFDEVPIFTTGLKKLHPAKTGMIEKIKFPVKN